MTSLLGNEERGTQHELETPLLANEERNNSTRADVTVAASTSPLACRSGDNAAGSDASTEAEPVSERGHPLYSFKGRFVLGFVAFLNASLNVSLRMVYSLPGPPTPSALSMTRGWMSLASFLPLVLWNRKTSSSPPSASTEVEHHSVADSEQAPPISSSPRIPTTVSSHIASIHLAGAELAFWNFTSQALANSGVLTTPSARASFLGQTTVVMVPLFSALMGEHLSWKVYLGCLASLTGLICLARDGHGDDHDSDGHGESGGTSTGLGVGDFLILAGTVCWSLYIIRLGQRASHFQNISLQGIKNLYLAFMYSIWFLVADEEASNALWKGWKNPVAWCIILYSAIGPGTLADCFQQFGQERVPATESNLILSMEPVFTSVLGRIILGEETDWLEKTGGGFLILGALIASQN